MSALTGVACILVICTIFVHNSWLLALLRMFELTCTVYWVLSYPCVLLHYTHSVFVYNCAKYEFVYYYTMCISHTHYIYAFPIDISSVTHVCVDPHSPIENSSFLDSPVLLTTIYMSVFMLVLSVLVTKTPIETIWVHFSIYPYVLYWLHVCKIGLKLVLFSPISQTSTVKY